MVRNPAIYQLADLIPDADHSQGGRRRQYPEYMWLIYEALISDFGSARQVEAELSHALIWGLIRDKVRRRYPMDMSRWLPDTPMRRHHNLYARNRYLTEPDVFAALASLHRDLAAGPARALGLLDPDGPGSWTHPDLSRMLHADGKVITHSFALGPATPASTRSPARFLPAAPIRMVDFMSKATV